MEEHYLKLKLPAVSFPAADFFHLGEAPLALPPNLLPKHAKERIEMGLSLVLPSSLKLPLLGPSMDLMNTHNHLYHNPLSKTQAFE
ncbi:unnamed protein product [Prunus armeniaca]